MTAVHRLLTVLAFAAVLAAPLSAAAATSCCVCTRAAGSNACRESRSHDGATAAVAASRTACDRVTRDLGGAYTCSFVADSGTGCTTQPNCAAGVGTVAPLNEEAPAAPAAPAGSPSSGGTTNVNVPFTPAVPTLALPIPSFAGFSTLQVQTEGENRYVDIPFVAEYILAVYRWSIGVIVTLAMVMIVVAGIRWVTAAGNASTIGAAKEMIVRSVMGLLLALGSYAILYLINPSLVQFRSIRVSLVRSADIPERPAGSDDPTEAAQGEPSEAAPPPTPSTEPIPDSPGPGCRWSRPPDFFARPRADLTLDRVNIRGVDETRCRGGMVYHPNVIEGFLAAQRETGVPAGFLLAQAQHESPRSFRQANQTGTMPRLLWGRKCTGAGRAVWLTDACPVGRRGEAELASLRSRCAAAGCSIIETREWCDRLETNAYLPSLACFQTFPDFLSAARSQGVFYRDRIGGEYCRGCGDVTNYMGSVTGFAARMSCVLPGGTRGDKWDNCLYQIIRQNCLEDARNEDIIALLPRLGPHGSCARSGNDARNRSASRDPYDTAIIDAAR